MQCDAYRELDCFVCMFIEQRHINVLQFRQSTFACRCITLAINIRCCNDNSGYYLFLCMRDVTANDLSNMLPNATCID